MKSLKMAWIVLLVVSSFGSVASAQTSWTWPGDLKTHLSQSHGVNTSGMTHAEMKRTHDSIHNGTQKVLKQSSCPGGVCPVQKGGTIRKVLRIRK